MASPERNLVLVVVAGVDDYQAKLLHGMQSVFAEHEIPMIAHVTGPSVNQLPPSLVHLIRHKRLRGVITSVSTGAGQERDLVRLTADLDVPRVHIGQHVSEASCVHADNVTGMRELMAHVLDECEAKRVVLVRGAPHQEDSIVREEVFREEMARRGIPLDEDLVITGRFDRQISYHAMRHLLMRRQDMDAVVALNDPSAMGALTALRDEGFRVPEDVSVTGFDNESIATLAWPGLTTVDQDAEGQGEAAASLLIEQLNNPGPREPIIIPSQLVIRGSTAPWGRTLTAEPDAVVDMARAAQVQLAAREAVLSVSRAMLNCRTTREIVDTLSARLDGLGIERCFLAMYERPLSEGQMNATGVELMRLILDYRHGCTLTPPGETFEAHRLLPGALQRELEAGVLVLQPLNLNTQDLGYVLFELVRGPALVTEVMQYDLTRALKAVATEETLSRQNTQVKRLATRLRDAERELNARRRHATLDHDPPLESRGPAGPSGPGRARTTARELRPREVHES